MVGHAPVINKRHGGNRGRTRRVSKASIRKGKVLLPVVVPPRMSNKKIRQLEKRLRHRAADEAARAAAGGAADAMDIDAGAAAKAMKAASKSVGIGGGKPGASAAVKAVFGAGGGAKMELS
jgi:hypothetical protein